MFKNKKNINIPKLVNLSDLTIMINCIDNKMYQYLPSIHIINLNKKLMFLTRPKYFGYFNFFPSSKRAKNKKPTILTYLMGMYIIDLR